jgi:integrase
LAAGWLRIGQAKTDAGTRRVKIRPVLHDVLAAHKARAADAGADAIVFATNTGAPQGRDNVRNRVFAKAAKRASERLEERGEAALPDGLTPHSLRRTFASVLYAIDEPPPVVMAEMGHTDPGLALRIYAQAMRRDDSESEGIGALVFGEDSGAMGTRPLLVPESTRIDPNPIRSDEL